jgi:hypothetical protein
MVPWEEQRACCRAQKVLQVVNNATATQVGFGDVVPKPWCPEKVKRKANTLQGRQCVDTVLAGQTVWLGQHVEHLIYVLG